MAKGIREKEEENKPTTEDPDGSVSDALDVIFSREEETYEQFVQSFIFLKKGTFKTSACTSSLQATGEKGNSAKMSTQDNEGNENIASLVTEELGPGEQSGTMTGPNRAPVGRIIKLDNFIGHERGTAESAESENEDTEDTECCYVPSAVQPDPQSTACPPLKLNNKKATKEDQDRLSSSDDLEAKLGGCSAVIPTFPGEVDSFEMDAGVEGQRKPNIRHLQISSSLRLPPDHEEVNEVKQDVEDAESKVEPFQLDRDFDYDNVPFTPKFDFLQRN